MPDPSRGSHLLLASLSYDAGLMSSVVTSLGRLALGLSALMVAQGCSARRRHPCVPASAGVPTAASPDAATGSQPRPTAADGNARHGRPKPGSASVWTL